MATAPAKRKTAATSKRSHTKKPIAGAATGATNSGGSTRKPAKKASKGTVLASRATMGE